MEKGFTGTDYARLLDTPHQQLGGPIVLIWNSPNTHCSKAMQRLIAARRWLVVRQLPPYAPDLNPFEAVWSHLKRSLANLAIDQLARIVKARLKRMQYHSTLIA